MKDHLGQTGQKTALRNVVIYSISRQNYFMVKLLTHD